MVNRFHLGFHRLVTMSQFGMSWFGMSWFSMSWFSLSWFNMSWFSMSWFGMSWFPFDSNPPQLYKHSFVGSLLAQHLLVHSLSSTFILSISLNMFTQLLVVYYTGEQ